ncbi:MAG: hypothetical protein V4671_19940 [Armatimonadota bacterium]
MIQMIQGFLPQDRSILVILALIILITAGAAMNYLSRQRRRSRRRQEFYDKLRQHQEATSTKEAASE